MQETTKWLVTVVVALWSLLLSGARFGDVAALEGHQRVVALRGFAIALLGTGVFVACAVRVLAAPLETLRRELVPKGRLKRRSLEAALERPAQLDAVAAESDVLLRGRADDEAQLFSRLNQKAGSLRVAITGGDANAAAALRDEVDDLVDTAERVAQFLTYWRTRRRFRWMAGSLILSLAAVLVGVDMFHAAMEDLPQPVSTPTPVIVYFAEDGAQPTRRCQLLEREGVAVDGTWKAPVVLFPPAARRPRSCPPEERTLVTGEAVVVPKTPES